MDTSHYISALRENGAALADAAEGNLGHPVPSCSGWNVADLVWHTGEVHRFWLAIAVGDISGPQDYTEPDRPADDDLLGWYRDGLEETARALSGVDPSAERWTWAPQKNAGFIQRRMAQETLVHAWDARNAVGQALELPADLAADGVDEFLAFMLALGSGPPEGFDAVVCLRAADSGRAWTVDPSAGTWRTRPVAEDGATTTVEGAASDLLLLLWGRTDTSRVRVDGDGDALATLLAAAGTE
ncbi:maleylpyruvate isomerase family mycothiol-dependent enzyme [Nocardiopsis dassonvillei]|uniref:maleylpyruvate isomerase family mycothiol-dependent enzyme n=1 Tax=Nocardiopsis dassonvillei TaxID=2014 RepID=UPI0033D9B905